MNIGIVLLYGLVDLERKDYIDYLNFILKDIRSKKFDKVILCGGYTNLKEPNASEASSALEYFQSKFPDFSNYILEDKSISSNQNLEFAAKYLKNISNKNNITVYCELMRLAKIIWMSMHFLLNETQDDTYKQFFNFTYKRKLEPFVYKNLSVIGFDFEGRTKEEIIGQSFATLIDVMSIYNKKYNEMDIEQRKKDFGLV